MAGIGFELRRMLRKNTLVGLVQAYAYAGVIGSGPWVFSIVGILLIGIFSASVVCRACSSPSSRRPSPTWWRQPHPHRTGATGVHALRVRPALREAQGLDPAQPARPAAGDHAGRRGPGHAGALHRAAAPGAGVPHAHARGLHPHVRRVGAHRAAVGHEALQGDRGAFRRVVRRHRGQRAADAALGPGRTARGLRSGQLPAARGHVAARGARVQPARPHHRLRLRGPQAALPLPGRHRLPLQLRDLGGQVHVLVLPATSSPSSGRCGPR